MTSRGQEDESVTTTSVDLLAERIAQMGNLFPEVFTEGKIDFVKLRTILGDFVDEHPERYSFTWAGKRDAIRILQVPTRATLLPCPDESINWETTNHLFIEGDNLEVLKLLLKPYFGRVKMIYIDPPYNTGNDFIYPDNYADPLDTYLRLTGQKDEEGNLLTSNPETSGRYHSVWLSMMYPRLFLARQLLREDGVIFVTIGDREVHNLRMLMNEVFGEECFKNCIIFRRGIKNVQAQFDTVDSLAVGHDYVVMYAKNSQTRFKKLYVPLDSGKKGDGGKKGKWNNHWRGTDRPTMRYKLFGIKPTSGQWRWSEKRSRKAIENYQRMVQELGGDESQITQEQIDEWYLRECNRTGQKIDLLRLSSTEKPEHYVPPTDVKLGSDLWTDLSPRGSAELESLFGCKVFDTPKPVGLIKRMLEFTTDSQQGDIIVDFFAGSCTTAQAVLELNREDGGNRRFIMVQLPEPLPEPKTLDDGTVLRTIAEVGKERIRRVIARMQQERKSNSELQDLPEDLGFKVFKLAPSNFRTWTGVSEEMSPEAYADQMELFIDPLVEGWTLENVIAEVAIKEAGFSLNYCMKMVDTVPEQSVYRVYDPEKDQAFYICLDDKVRLDNLKPLNLTRDDLFVCRSKALDDETAANMALQCRLKII